MATRRKIVSASIAEDGTQASFAVMGEPDASGKQAVLDTIVFSADMIPADKLNRHALYGIQQLVTNRTNRLDEDVTPEAVGAAVTEVLTAVRDNTWAPGRQFGEREPTDLELAIAEATGRDVRSIIDDIEHKLVLNDDGTPKLSKNGRQSRVFNARMLAAIASDPKVKPILARIVAERARRLGAEAKRGGADTGLLSSMFGAASAASEPATQEAAN